VDHVFECLHHLYLFIHTICIRLNNVYAIYLNLTQHFRLLCLLLLITDSAAWQLRVLIREDQPCLLSDWRVQNFRGSLQRLHKLLIRPPPCSGSQN